MKNFVIELPLRLFAFSLSLDLNVSIVTGLSSGVGKGLEF